VLCLNMSSFGYPQCLLGFIVRIVQLDVICRLIGMGRRSWFMFSFQYSAASFAKTSM